jgi:adenylate cyclase class 2
MGFEVEMKFRAAGGDAIAQRLEGLGAIPGQSVAQEDAYFNHPVRDFAQTNEALRLRRQGDENRITYKGPRHAGPTKTREEIEIPIGEGRESFEDLTRLFEKLGFRPVATVRKSRRPFHIRYQGRDMEVAIDDAEGLGRFVEVEALAKDERDLAAAQQAVLGLAGVLGLSEAEPRSYLGMALERAGATPRPRRTEG